LFIGTSTSGILESEIAFRHRDPVSGVLPRTFAYAGAHNTYSIAAFLREFLQIEGPAFVVSTACSSSAKVFAAAHRMITAGIIDAALVGGVDSLCLTTLYGFHSLQLTSNRPCRPFAADRDGLSIGEAAAFALLVRPDGGTTTGDILYLGAGESSDAYHLSTPHPEGLGAQMAMRAALAASGLRADQIDYINLHGTATPSNDRAESHAVQAVFGAQVPCSSTKGSTGHTLGAAGALEAVIAALSIARRFMPGGVIAANPDPSLRVNYLTRTQAAVTAHVMSNSFGFGGTNCSLILGSAV
jgi:3-oxoacyl-[acyl-carrier-protein] synthase-1